MTWDTFVVNTINVNQKKIKNTGALNFNKRYLYHEPMNRLLGGHIKTFESIVCCIGVGFGIKKELTMTALSGEVLPWRGR